MMLTLGVSRRLRMLFAVAGLSAGLLVLAWPWWAMLPWWLAVIAATRSAIRRHATLQAPEALVGLRYDASGALRVQSRDGAWHAATLLGSTTVTPWGAILHLRLPGKRFSRSMLIVPDAVDAMAFRHLRVRLRWGGEA